MTHGPRLTLYSCPPPTDGGSHVQGETSSLITIGLWTVLREKLVQSYRETGTEGD